MPSEAQRLRVIVPEVERVPIRSTLEIPNLNPQLGSRPLDSPQIYYEDEVYGNFCADVSPDFLDAMMKPRGRPHLTLLHLAIFDDDLAAISFTAIEMEMYGKRWRYLEASGQFCFHREAFLKGCVRAPSKGAISVDRFQIFWELIREKPHASIIKRGVWRLMVMGIRDQEPIHVASLEGRYYRFPAVENIYACG